MAQLISAIKVSRIMAIYRWGGFCAVACGDTHTFLLRSQFGLIRWPSLTYCSLLDQMQASDLQDKPDKGVKICQDCRLNQSKALRPCMHIIG